MPDFHTCWSYHVDLLYQTNWEVTERTFILLVSSDANSCFGLTRAVSHHIESFLFVVRLQ